MSIEAVLPSGAVVVIDGVGAADTVSTLKARLSLAPELSGCAFYTMHGSSYMVDWLTLGDYNVQSRSTIRVLHHDALPGGVGVSVVDATVPVRARDSPIV